MIENTRKSRDVLATVSTLRPADFPVGSAQSRAAARMLAQQRESQRERLEIIISGEPELYASDWSERWDGKLIRTLCLPDSTVVVQ